METSFEGHFVQQLSREEVTTWVGIIHKQFTFMQIKLY